MLQLQVLIIALFPGFIFLALLPLVTKIVFRQWYEEKWRFIQQVGELSSKLPEEFAQRFHIQ